MEYFYRAIRKDGERTSGFIKAGSSSSARRKLLEKYSSILEISEADAKSVPKKKKFRVKPESVVVFFRRLATLLSSGVPLADSLEFIGNAGTGDQLAEAIEHLAGMVHQGHSFGMSLKDPLFSGAFDDVSVGMIQLGEQTGQLARVVDKLADLKERQLSLTRSFISALTYPAVLFCCIIALGVLFTMILGPGDEGLFAAFKTELPWPTKVVQAISQGVRNPWLVFSILAVVILGGWSFRFQMKNSLTFRHRVHALALSTPFLGNLIRKIESARILYVLSDALSVGVPLATAFSMTPNVVGNEKIKRKVKAVHNEFCEGVSLMDSLQVHRVFDPLVLCFIETGIESGNLDMIMARASKNIEEDVRIGLEGISQLAEPLLLIFAGLMAGFLALATLMPIINMVDTL